MAKHRPSLRVRRGRELEELVAALESELRPEGVTIRSPDRVRDRDTGELREVDVTVRFASPDGEKLVALECRDRRASQDVRWFEELASKRESIGADQMIAVSSSPFTPSALKKACRYGILARQLKDVSLQSIADWLWLDGTLYRHESRILSASATVAWESVGAEQRPGLEAEVEALPRAELGDRNLQRALTGTPVSVIETWESVLSADREQVLFSQVPEDGSRKLLNATIHLEDSDLQLAVPLRTARLLLSSLTLKVELWKVPTKPRLLRVREYRSGETDIARAADYSFGGATLTVLNVPETGRYTLTAAGTPNAQHSGRFALWNPGPLMRERVLQSLEGDEEA